MAALRSSSIQSKSLRTLSYRYHSLQHTYNDFHTYLLKSRISLKGKTVMIFAHYTMCNMRDYVLQII